jgi:hypothetical protein
MAESTGEIQLPWKAEALEGFNTSSGYTYNGGTVTGGGPSLPLRLTVRKNSHYGEPATVQIDVGDRRNATSVSLKPDLARQAAAALLAAADKAEEDIEHWRQVWERQREEMAALMARNAMAKAGLSEEVP